ncbi:hypothetical protein HY837_04750 [archaeon]|nr:hypothetical protein [archaeon]
MALKFPSNMDECAYFTRRTMGQGNAVTWVFKETCPKCKKGTMGKPRDPKTGKPKIRAKEYECPECGNVVEKEAYEDTLTANIQYNCPKCKNSGETQVPFARKKVQLFDEEKQKKVSADAVVFFCSKCKERLVITKKMK